MTVDRLYRGRFAPSPTGPLHFGSLVAALASYLDARSQGGVWLVRIEDIDPPREVPGATTSILRSLEAHGLTWDGDVVLQSTRTQAYEHALDQLRRMGAVYPCACTRKEIADSQRQFASSARPGASIYPGTCRSGIASGRTARAERVRVADAVVRFDDLIQQTISQDLAAEVGDFVLRRADGLIAYQLAVVVDDAAQRISTVVRGADLLDSTPRQIYLQQLLALPMPQYAHLPVVVNEAGEKLSKQTRATPLHDDQAAGNLRRALRFLGYQPDADSVSVTELLDWATHAWRLTRVPRLRARTEPP